MAMAPRRLMPNGENCSLAELEIAMKCTPRKRSFIRIDGIRALMMGFDHAAVAGLCQVSRATLNNWIGRFNGAGVEGLIERPRRGRPRKISAQQSERYRELVRRPDLAGQVHWTGRKFHGYLRKELEQEVGYSTVVRWLHENGFRLKVPQPWPDRHNEQEREAFVERVRGWLEDEGVELWYLDEMGVEGDPRPRRRWVEKGVKVRVTKNGDHLRMNVTGMLCPRTGEFYALEFTHSDGEVFQSFLDYANADVRLERSRNLLICDNASWHKGGKIRWGGFEPVFLPGYSPDLNPIEKLWLVIKAEWFSDFVAKSSEHLVERLDQALLWAMDRQQNNQRTCAIKKEL